MYQVYKKLKKKLNALFSYINTKIPSFYFFQRSASNTTSNMYKSPEDDTPIPMLGGTQ